LIIGDLFYEENSIVTSPADIHAQITEIGTSYNAAAVFANSIKEDEVNDSSSFVDDLGADSLDTVELVMALEEEFECEIPDEEAEKITTVQQAIDYVKAHLG